jgi:cytochrome P450
MINDEVFKNKDESIIDECITFFLAGSATTKIANSNLLMYLTLYPETLTKLKSELISKLFRPYKVQNPGASYDISSIFDYNIVQEMPYFSMCFNESLRIEAPA